MSEDTGAGGADIEQLRARADDLERQLREMAENADARVVRAELKAEAVRYGMVDLDGLKLVEPDQVRVNQRGEVEGAESVMQQLKRDKPWLFAGPSSSSRASPPPAYPPRPRLATEMTLEEYRAARAELLRRR